MLSRKEFFKDLLIRAARAINHLAGEGEGRSPGSAGAGHEFDLPATELSPALLAVEAECRGIDLQVKCTENLKREIYRELAQYRPDAGSNADR
jgi:hypothetical protein